MAPPTVYQESLITPRSRRLRVLGLILLASVIGMALYGNFIFMPAINRAISARTRIVRVEAPNDGTGYAEYKKTRTARALKVQLLSIYSYWIICGLLLLSTFFVAWLDLREVTRNYDHRRLDAFRAAADFSGAAMQPGDPAEKPGTERL